MVDKTIEDIHTQNTQTGWKDAVFFDLPGVDKLTRKRRGIAPSRPITILGFPAPENTFAEFTYNRYDQNEYVSEEPSLDIPISLQNSSLFLEGDIPLGVTVQAGSETIIIDPTDVRAYAPRTNFISWSQQTPIDIDFPDSGIVSVEESTDKEELIRKALGNMSQIPNDVSLGHVSQTSRFSSLQLQDTNFTEQVGGMINDLQQAPISSHVTGPQLPYPQEITPLTSAGGGVGGAAVVADAAMAVAGGLVGSDGWEFGEEGKFSTANDNIRNVGMVDHFAQISNKVVGQVFRSACNTPHTFAMDYSSDLDNAHSIEENVSNINNSQLINEKEFELLLLDVEREILDDPDSDAAKTRFEPIGYIIEKYEMMAGKKIEKKPLVVGDPRITTVVDTRIKLGAIYAYRVRSVVQVSFACAETDDLDGQFFLAKALFSSNPSPFAVVNTSVTRSPAPPEDLRFLYDYKDDGLIFTWNFPVEREQDIKYFQVLRRKSTFEPFQLIAFYNFNDTDIGFQPELQEHIDTNNLEEIQLKNVFAADGTSKTMPDPNTMYIDYDFNKDATFIYALASVDAHGNISNYSGQFLVFFDRLTNKIGIRSISWPGAPRAYPNMFLRQDSGGRLSSAPGFADKGTGGTEQQIVSDLSKVSGNRNMRIYFSPSAMKINNAGAPAPEVRIAAGNNLGVPGGYIAAIYNIDNGASQLLNIEIKDNAV